MLRGAGWVVTSRLATTPRAFRSTARVCSRVGGGGADVVGRRARMGRWASVEDGSRRRIHTRAAAAAAGDGVGGEQVERLTRFDSHEQLVQHLLALHGDPLEADGGRVVVHRGNPNARLMVIGEGPGAEVRIPGVTSKTLRVAVAFARRLYVPCVLVPCCLPFVPSTAAAMHSFIQLWDDVNVVSLPRAPRHTSLPR